MVLGKVIKADQLAKIAKMSSNTVGNLWREKYLSWTNSLGCHKVMKIEIAKRFVAENNHRTTKDLKVINRDLDLFGTDIFELERQ